MLRTVALSTLAGCSGAPSFAGDAPADYNADTVSWTSLFAGELTSAWKMSVIANQPGHDDPGRFELVDGALRAVPGNDIGLLWYTQPTPESFELALEWNQASPDDNSGVFVRFPDLDSKGYDNTAWVAVNFGFEIQIDNHGYPDGAPKHTTGAIYNVDAQDFSLVHPRAVGEWNEYRIRVIGDVYEVFLNDQQTTRFVNNDPTRGAASPAFIGLQTHPAPGSVAFRNIRIREISSAAVRD